MPYLAIRTDALKPMVYAIDVCPSHEGSLIKYKKIATAVILHLSAGEVSQIERYILVDSSRLIHLVVDTIKRDFVYPEVK